MAKVASADLTEKLGWFGPIRFVTVEWRDSARLVLLRYSYNDGPVEDLGVRLDLDKKAFLDDVEDESANQIIHQKAPEIWAVVAREYANARRVTR